MIARWNPLRPWEVVWLLSIVVALGSLSVNPSAAGAAGATAGVSTIATPAIQVYSDDLGPCWVDWSWNRGPAFDLYSQAEVYSGNYSIEADLGAWGGLSFHRPDLRTGPEDALEFYIHGGATGGQQLRVFLYGPGGGSGSELPAVSLNTPLYIEGGTVDAGTWKQALIPLAELSAANTVIGRISIQAVGNQPLFYIDDVRLIGSQTPPPLEPLDLRVNVADVKGTISRSAFGTNAIWWSENLQQNADVIARLRAAGIKTIRFPGGSEADKYHWQIYEPGDASNAWATNTTDFIQFVQAVGAEPMITANFGTGSAQEAAAWVRFTNVEHNWDVTYWEVGNEIYGDWEQSWTHDPTAYTLGDATHDGFLAFCQAMKAVDPTIKVGAVGAPYQGQYNNWGATVLNLAGDCMDFYTFPYYPLNPGVRSYDRLLGDPIVSWTDMGRDVAAMLAQYGPAHRAIQVAVSEYNSYTSEPEDLAVQTVNMLFLADTLGQILEQGFPLANQWNIMQGASAHGGDYGFLLRGTGLYRQPSYYAPALWQYAGDLRLDSTLNRDACTEMTAYASRAAASGAVSILAINKTGVEQTGSVSLDSVQIANASLVARVAQGADLTTEVVTYNGVTDPPVDLEQVAPQITHGIAQTFSYVFPPYSVTALKIVAAPAAAAVTIGLAAGVPQLRWSHSPLNHHYEVHCGADPYFSPGAGTLYDRLNGPFDAEIIYPDTAYESGLNRFYCVLSTNDAGDSTLSNRAGVFDFTLTPGS